MAVKKIRGAKSDTPYNYGIWLADNVSDISLLPTSKDKKDNTTTTSIGSLAYVTNGAKKYILSNDDTWKDITSGGGIISDNYV